MAADKRLPWCEGQKLAVKGRFWGRLGVVSRRNKCYFGGFCQVHVDSDATVGANRPQMAAGRVVAIHALRLVFDTAADRG